MRALWTANLANHWLQVNILQWNGYYKTFLIAFSDWFYRGHSLLIKFVLVGKAKFFPEEWWRALVLLNHQWVSFSFQRQWMMCSKSKLFSPTLNQQYSERRKLWFRNAWHQTPYQTNEPSAITSAKRIESNSKTWLMLDFFWKLNWKCKHFT